MSSTRNQASRTDLTVESYTTSTAVIVILGNARNIQVSKWLKFCFDFSSSSGRWEEEGGREGWKRGMEREGVRYMFQKQSCGAFWHTLTLNVPAEAEKTETVLRAAWSHPVCRGNLSPQCTFHNHATAVGLNGLGGKRQERRPRSTGKLHEFVASPQGRSTQAWRH
jgi:hypothetical protein